MKKKKWRISYNSPAILTFVLICVAVTGLNYLTGGISNRTLFMTYHSSLTNPLTYLRFFTHVFGHANWSHLIGNATYLLLLGPILEEKYGSKQIVEIMAITAGVTGVLNYILFPNIALCGASGIVFALILLVSFAGFEDGTIPVTFILVAVLFLGEQVYEGIFETDNISNISHIAGGIIGAAFGFYLNRGRKRKPRTRVKTKTKEKKA